MNFDATAKSVHVPLDRRTPEFGLSAPIGRSAKSDSDRHCLTIAPSRTERLAHRPPSTKRDGRLSYQRTSLDPVLRQLL